MSFYDVDALIDTIEPDRRASIGVWCSNAQALSANPSFEIKSSNRPISIHDVLSCDVSD
jgi:hypothetical protein